MVTAGCGGLRSVVRDAGTGEFLQTLDGCAAFDVTAGGILVRHAGGKLRWRRIEQAGVRSVRARLTSQSPLQAAGRAVLVETPRPGGSALTLVRRNGSRRVIARFNQAWKRIADVDFDGKRVAWAERRCGAPRVVVTTLDRPRKDPPLRCG